MLKKIALFGAAACFAFSAAATAGGLYVGAGAGYGYMKRNLSFTDVSQFVVAVPTTDVFNNLNNSQFGSGSIGKLFAGYGFCLDSNWYVAPEIFWSLSNVKTTTSNTNQFIEFGVTPTGIGSVPFWTEKLKETYGVGIRPGYYIYDNTLLFADLGYARGDFSATDERLTMTATGALLGGGVLGVSQSHWANGFQYGAGVEVNLTSQLGVRAEFLQTRYGSWNWVDTTTDPTVTLAISEKPTVNEADVSLVWTIGDLA